MVIRTGIVGYSENNGHPFSFSSIVNGYNPEALITARWQVIHDYLAKQPPEAFNIQNARITHAWTQFPEVTRALCAAAHIPNMVENFPDMLGQVDAVIIARDDYEAHFALAKPFLDYGIPVFIDKPLAFDKDELRYFAKFLENGMLMSTSGMRYAKELDELRADPAMLGEIKLIEGVVLNNLEKYGIHLLDAINGLGFGHVRSIQRLPALFEAYTLTLDSGITFNLSCLGPVGKTFHLSFYGTKNHIHVDLHDNFSAFKCTLQTFFSMVETKAPPIEPQETLRTMQLIALARTLEPNNNENICV